MTEFDKLREKSALGVKGCGKPYNFKTKKMIKTVDNCRTLGTFIFM